MSLNAVGDKNFMLKEKTEVAISACLLGQRVRYDGKEKRQAQIVDFFSKRFSEQVSIIPFCPEVAIGLGVPRPKIHLVRQKNEQIRVLGVENHTIDVTESLESYASEFLRHYPGLSHLIVKSRSPSCGYQSTPLMINTGGRSANDNKTVKQKDASYKQIALTSGLFVQTILDMKPELQIADETQLITEQDCLKFLHGRQQQKNT